MDFSTSRTFNGGTGTASLIIGGGVTNTATSRPRWQAMAS